MNLEAEELSRDLPAPHLDSSDWLNLQGATWTEVPPPPHPPPPTKDRSTFKANKSVHPDLGGFDLPTERRVWSVPFVPALGSCFLLLGVNRHEVIRRGET